DDPAAVTQAAGRFAQRVERTLEVDVYLALEGQVTSLGDVRQQHDAGIVDEHIDAAERRLGSVEHAADGLLIADIGLRAQRAAALVLDLARHGFGGRGVARVVDDDGKAVPGQPLRHRGADAARGSGHDRYFVVSVGHFQSPDQSARLFPLLLRDTWTFSPSG